MADNWTGPTLFLAAGERSAKAVQKLERDMEILPVWRMVFQAHTISSAELFKHITETMMAEPFRKTRDMDVDSLHPEPRLALLLDIGQDQPLRILETLNQAKKENLNLWETIAMEITCFLINRDESILEENVVKALSQISPVQTWVVDCKNEKVLGLSEEYATTQTAIWLYFWATGITYSEALRDNLRKNQTTSREDIFMATGSFGIEEIPLRPIGLAEKLASRFYYECIYPHITTGKTDHDAIPSGIADWLLQGTIPSSVGLQKDLEGLVTDGVRRNKGLPWIQYHLQEWADHLHQNAVAYEYDKEKARWDKTMDEFTLRLMAHPLPVSPKIQPRRQSRPKSPAIVKWQKYLLGFVVLVSIVYAMYSVVSEQGMSHDVFFILELVDWMLLLTLPAIGAAIALMVTTLKMYKTRFVPLMRIIPMEEPMVKKERKWWLILLASLAFLMPFQTILLSEFFEIEIMDFILASCWQTVVFILLGLWILAILFEEAKKRLAKVPDDDLPHATGQTISSDADISATDFPDKQTLETGLKQTRQKIAQSGRQAAEILNMRESILQWIHKLETRVETTYEPGSNLLDEIYQYLKVALKERYTKNLTEQITSYVVENPSTAPFVERLLQDLTEEFLTEIQKRENIQQGITTYFANKHAPLANWRLADARLTSFSLIVGTSSKKRSLFGNFPCDFIPEIPWKTKEESLWLTRVVQLQQTFGKRNPV